MQHDWFMYHLRSTYKNRLDFPFNMYFQKLRHMHVYIYQLNLMWNSQITGKCMWIDSKITVCMNEKGFFFFFCSQILLNSLWLFFFISNQGAGPYTKPIKQVEDDIQAVVKRVNELTGKFVIHCHPNEFMCRHFVQGDEWIYHPQHQGENTGENKQHMKMYATSVIYDTTYSKMNFGRLVGVEMGGGLIQAV